LTHRHHPVRHAGVRRHDKECVGTADHLDTWCDMTRIVSAREANQQFSELLDRAAEALDAAG